MATKKTTQVLTIAKSELNFTEKDYKEFLEQNEYSADEWSFEDYMNWALEVESANLETILTTCKFAKRYNTNVVITGSVQTWCGVKEIVPDLQPNLEDAVRKCIRSGEDYAVQFGNGGVCVQVMHHDGTNRFIIRPLNKKGYNSLMSNGIKEYMIGRFKLEDIL